MQSDRNDMPAAKVIDLFDRKIGALEGLPDVVSAKPTTLRSVDPMIGDSQTFIVQTYRSREAGDTIFIEQTSANGHVRLVLPPNVADAIARQRESLTGRVRSQSARERMKDRMAAGFVPTFGGKRGGRKAKKKAKPAEGGAK
jgi:hypothetical protein